MRGQQFTAIERQKPIAHCKQGQRSLHDRQQIGMFFVHRFQPQRSIQGEFDSITIMPSFAGLYGMFRA